MTEEIKPDDAFTMVSVCLSTVITRMRNAQMGDSYNDISCDKMSITYIHFMVKI